MKYAYHFTLARRAVVVTMDLSAANLELLQTDHWLSDQRNVIVFRLTEPAWVGGVAPVLHTKTPQEEALSWTASDVYAFLKSRDLASPGRVLFNNGVRGLDLIQMEEGVLLNDLRLCNFAAQKVLQARDTYLS